jgi:hypothetical protein
VRGFSRSRFYFHNYRTNSPPVLGGAGGGQASKSLPPHPADTPPKTGGGFVEFFLEAMLDSFFLVIAPGAAGYWRRDGSPVTSVIGELSVSFFIYPPLNTFEPKLKSFGFLFFVSGMIPCAEGAVRW